MGGGDLGLSFLTSSCDVSGERPGSTGKRSIFAAGTQVCVNMLVWMKCMRMVVVFKTLVFITIALMVKVTRQASYHVGTILHWPLNLAIAVLDRW